MTAPRKRRTRAHVIADLGVNHVERVVLRCGYSVFRVPGGADYGTDLIVSTHAGDGGLESGGIRFQVKATDRLPRLATAPAVSFKVEIADVSYWRRQNVPFVLLVYDAAAERAYWLDVREWARGREWTAADWRAKSVQVRIPLTNRFTVPAMRRLRLRKNELIGEGGV